MPGAFGWRSDFGCSVLDVGCWMFPQLLSSMPDASPSAEPPKLKIYFLPNLFTAGNLFCGFVALTKIVEADAGTPDFNHIIKNALFFILLACIFDLLDG